MTDRWPARHRLYGGRNTHASRPTGSAPYGMTACGYPVSGKDQQQPDDAPVTCRACKRETSR